MNNFLVVLLYLGIVVTAVIVHKYSYKVLPSELLRGIWVAFTLIVLSWIPWGYFAIEHDRSMFANNGDEEDQDKKMSEGKGKKQCYMFACTDRSNH